MNVEKQLKRTIRDLSLLLIIVSALLFFQTINTLFLSAEIKQLKLMVSR